jgi:hypothetical protein
MVNGYCDDRTVAFPLATRPGVRRNGAR